MLDNNNNVDNLANSAINTNTLDTTKTPKTKRKYTISDKVGRPITWTIEKSIELTEDIIEWFEDNPQKKCMVDYYATHQGIYRSIIDMLVERYNDKKVEENYIFLSNLKVIHSILESRLVEAGLTARNPVFPMFLLTNYYSDRYKNQHSVHQTGEITVQHTIGINTAWKEHIESISNQHSTPAIEENKAILPNSASDEDNSTSDE